MASARLAPPGPLYSRQGREVPARAQAEYAYPSRVDCIVARVLSDPYHCIPHVIIWLDRGIGGSVAPALAQPAIAHAYRLRYAGQAIVDDEDDQPLSLMKSATSIWV